jgi:putative transposase
MAQFRSAKSLQKFAAVHASVHNHANLERHFYNRENFKINRSAALADETSCAHGIGSSFDGETAR